MRNKKLGDPENSYGLAIKIHTSSCAFCVEVIIITHGNHILELYRMEKISACLYFVFV